jgi:hypothetical protein
VTAFLRADPGRTALAFKQTPEGVVIPLPATAPDAVASVVCVETEGGSAP